jgi:capsular exopolysaccharide synthesis family protein
MKTIRIQPPRRLAEQFEVLKCRLMAQLNGQSAGPYVLAFTSCESGEGVTNIAANFTATLADEGGRHVLLVDGNLRTPALETIFETNGKKPKKFSKSKELRALSAPAWRVFRANENLDVLLARRAFDNPARIFGNAEFTEFLKRAKEQYDFIIIDCPAMGSPGGAAVLASKADGVVLVVEAGRVRREVIQRAIVQLEDTGTYILGVVLNKRRFPIPKFFYRFL